MATHPLTLVLVLQRGRVLRAVLLSPGLCTPPGIRPRSWTQCAKGFRGRFSASAPCNSANLPPARWPVCLPVHALRHACPALSCRSSRQQAPEGLQYLCWRLIDDSIPAHPIPRPCRGAAGRSRAPGGTQLSARIPAPSDQRTNKLRTFNVLPRGKVWVRDVGGASCLVGHL